MQTVETDPDPPTSVSTLVVEDEVLHRMALAEELRSAGFRVVEVCDGDEALIILQ